MYAIIYTPSTAVVDLDLVQLYVLASISNTSIRLSAAAAWLRSSAVCASVRAMGGSFQPSPASLRAAGWLLQRRHCDAIAMAPPAFVEAAERRASERQRRKEERKEEQQQRERVLRRRRPAVAAAAAARRALAAAPEVGLVASGLGRGVVQR